MNQTEKMEMQVAEEQDGSAVVQMPPGEMPDQPQDAPRQAASDDLDDDHDDGDDGDDR